jgi:hypothetical protein
MPQNRPAESPKARSWNRGVPNDNDLTEVRPWAIWGHETPSELAATDTSDPLPGDPGNDVAWELAQDADPEWAETRRDDAFVRVWETDEGDVLGLVEDDGRVEGYAPYLIEARRGPTAR